MTGPTTNAEIREAYEDGRIIRRLSADPSNPDDGEMWYRTDLDEYRGVVAGAVVSFNTTAV